MKIKPVAYFLLAIFAFGGCTFFSEKEIVDPWQLVPHDSFAVWELPTLKVVDSVFGFTWTSKAVSYLNIKERESSSINYLVALKQNGSNVSGFVVMPKAWIKWDSVAGDNKFKKRLYEGVSLWETVSAGGQLVISDIAGLGVLSTNSLMVEEAIRQYRNGSISIKDTNNYLFQSPTSKNDFGNLFLTCHGLAKILENELEINPKRHFSMLFESAIVDFSSTSSSLLFQGFASDSSHQRRSILSTLQFQKPVANDLLSFAPVDFDFIVHLGFSDAENWLAQRDLLIKEVDSVARENTKESDYKDFFTSVDNELAFVSESGREAVMIELKEISKGLRLFKNYAAKKGEVGLYESYLESDIYFVEAPGMLTELFAPFFLETPTFYYAIVNQVMVIVQEIDLVKKILDKVNQDETIGKSIEWRAFLKDSQLETNLTVLLNNKGGRLLKDSNNNGFLARMDKSAIQFSKVNKNFYVSSVISIGKPSMEKISTREILLNDKVRKVNIVKSHASDDDEIFFFLESNQIGLADLNQKILWAKQIAGILPTDVAQIDFLKNRKLQYLILTERGINLIDRLGNEVEPFPVALNIDRPLGLRVIDYDRSKNYRYLITTVDGKISLFDRTGKTLDGWESKTVGELTKELPRHIRIDGRDAFVVPGNDRVHLFNRRGEPIKGFPFKLNDKFDGSVFVKDKTLTLVSRDGHLYSLDITGRLISDEVLLKNTKEATFGLLNTSDFESCVIYKIEQGKVSLIDIQGNTLFETANPLSPDVKLTYYSFGKNRKVVSVYDEEQNLFYLLNALTGEMLLRRPVTSTCNPGLSLNRQNDNLQVVYAVENRILISSIPY